MSLPFSNRRRSDTVVKMTNKFGRVGTENEWRNNVYGRTATRHTGESMNYSRDLSLDPELAAGVKGYIEEVWWADLCRSANSQVFWDCLFEEHWFDEEGVMDVKEPAFKKIIQSIGFGYMHIVDQYGGETLPGWTCLWAMGKDGPFIRMRNKELNKGFGMAMPMSGFLDHANELVALRKKRDAGEYLTVPEAKMKFYNSNSSNSTVLSSEAVTNNEGSSTTFEVPDMEDVLLSPAKKKPLASETSELGGEDWAIVGEDGEAMDGADNLWDEAKKNGTPNDGYMYNQQDSKPARRRWFGR